ncbi:MAG: PilZ domain-containing protein [Spirochaetia bacterium]
MAKIIVYSESLEIHRIVSALPEQEIVPAASTAELARAIIEQSHVIALIIEKERIDDRFQRLLASIKKSFPILQVCLITDSGADLAPAGYRIIAKDITPEGSDRFTEELKTFVSSIGLTERRDHLRFDWPLQGMISFDDKTWQSYNLWALSADGAFLESSGSGPPVGSRGILRISFQNFRLVTRCEVLDPRQASSKLPAGFAVRLTMLSDDSMNLINRIIQDALLQTLLQPESEPAIPTLGEEDLSISGFEPL